MAMPWCGAGPCDQKNLSGGRSASSAASRADSSSLATTPRTLSLRARFVSWMRTTLRRNTASQSWTSCAVEPCSPRTLCASRGEWVPLNT
jgi:hypothetical protein